MQVLLVQCGGRRVGFSVADLIGVAGAEITFLPLAQSGHLGVMRFKGGVCPVFDPLALLGLGAVRSAPGLVAVLDVAGEALGLACQRVEGTVEVDEHSLVPGEGPWREGTIGGWPALVPDLAAALARGPS